MTPQEKLILRFLLTIFVVGLIVGYARRTWFTDRPVVGPEAREMAVEIAAITAKKDLQYVSEVVAESYDSKISKKSDNSSVVVDNKINLNTASKDELMLLPGIGSTIAERIIIFREDYGSFKSVDELQQVKGIGRKSIEKLQNLVTI